MNARERIELLQWEVERLQRLEARHTAIEYLVETSSTLLAAARALVEIEERRADSVSVDSVSG